MPRQIIPTKIHKLDKGKLHGELAERAAEEPKPLERIEPKCPKYLSASERKEWGYFASILKNYGLFDAANAMNLEMLAVNTVKWRQCLKKLKHKGLVLTTKGGKIVGMNPVFYAKNALEKEIRADLDRLGLSSQGLAKLGALSARGKKKNGIEELMD